MYQVLAVVNFIRFLYFTIPRRIEFTLTLQTSEGFRVNASG